MKVLIIDDSSQQRSFMRAQLLRMGHEVVLAVDGRHGIESFAAFNPDLILLDVQMPGIDGYETARLIRGGSEEWVPIIFLSGCDASDDIEAGIAAGGDDYLTKPCNPRVLEAKIRSMTRIAQMRRQLVDRGEELKAANAELTRIVDIDGLTGIANRRRLDQKLEEEILRGARNRSPLSVVLLDIDHFKQFNDAYGHLAGDECLKRVAMLLDVNMLRPGDLAARYGGEEFCAVLPETDAVGALMIAERLRVQIAEMKIDVPREANGVTASLGVATAFPAGHTLAASLLSDVDAALYSAKHGGRNKVYVSKQLEG
jgi:diguanylate cyclase (GGDEF)-like protein